jgi:hypothetical protein
VLRDSANVLADKVWQERLALLRRYHLCCEIEIFAPQLPDFRAVASSNPDIQFILPMGWPIDLTEAGHRDWKRDLEALSSCENVAVKIFGWNASLALIGRSTKSAPGILDTIEFFRPERCMFASYMPIAKVACSFQDLYRAYHDVVSEFSASERRKLFHDTANMVYGIGEPRSVARCEVLFERRINVGLRLYAVQRCHRHLGCHGLSERRLLEMVFPLAKVAGLCAEDFLNDGRAAQPCRDDGGAAARLSELRR